MSQQIIISRPLPLIQEFVPEDVPPDEIIYVDNTILSTFKTCEEKARLAYTEDWQTLKTAPALDFGGCFHAGIQGFYDAIADGKDREHCIVEAEHAFIKEWQARGGNLPTSLEDDEKRSVERGLWMLKAYIAKWKNEVYVNHTDNGGRPYTELGFSLYLMDWVRKGRRVPVMFVGRWDRIMRSRYDGKLWVFEVKTTSSGLTYFVLQVKPNHQITGYVYAAREILGLDVAGVVWDCAFVSSRKPNLKTNDHWLQVGIDFEKDFARQETRRTFQDLEEWLFDVRKATRDYLTLQDSGEPRWHRNAPTACHMYGGCQFRDVCASNNPSTILSSEFKKEKWKPWMGITEDA